MTAPIWIAAPPEVHSALLSSGLGPGPLLSAAEAWSRLSAEYALAADELTAVLGSVQAGQWEGPSAEQYVAAHLPYLAWLMQTSADSAQAATQHETAAAAYTTALATMPTLPELAANHATHAVLTATNFFGINTIPITLNEADYVRMWIQAASTMSAYQAVSATALASTPQTVPAPQILKFNTQTEDSEVPVEGSDPLDNLVADILRAITDGRVNWDPVSRTVNGIEYEEYTNPGDPIWWIVRALEFSQDFRTFARLLLIDPQAALQFYAELFLFDYPVHIPQLLTWLSQSPQLLAVAVGQAISGLGAVTGVAGLAGLGAQPAGSVAEALAPVVALPTMLPVAAMIPTVAAPATAPVSATAPAPATAPTAAGPAPAPPAAGGAGFSYPYLINGGPGIGFGSGMSTGASASAKKKAPEPDTAAAAAAAAREQARARRRRRATRRGYGDEFMDVEVDPDWGPPPSERSVASTVASEHGAGPVGIAGTVRNDSAAQATGLTTLGGDEFGGEPRTPMLPGTWDPERARDAGKEG
ncbi:putative PPE family protein PPE47/PPE48 [Mycobacterium marinum]|uniref:PPE family protein n=1 Tax=Mycobacterium marinum TaxID=1781 RepID=UPI000E3C059B|nr:PPE family protein [Mycobacterium marinum]RFZ21390.1 putative PPE family protein PPE47/PPE48 [Mycobacterium marinum]